MTRLARYIPQQTDNDNLHLIVLRDNISIYC